MALRTGKVTITAAAAAAAALLASGCGAGSAGQPAGGTLSAGKAITLAAKQAKQVSSFASTLTEKMSGTANGTLSGTMQIRTRPSLLAEVNMGTFSIAGHSLPGGMQEILTSRAIYLKMAAAAQQLHKPWAEIPYTTLRRGTGVNLAQLIQQVQSNNPLVQTQMLAGAKNVRAVGTQTINGVKTTRYAGSYTPAAGLAKLPPSLRAEASKGLRALGTRSIDFNVWIDAQHQTRKVVVADNGSVERITITMQVTGINQPVSVKVPAASQVATVPASVLGG
jgi:hypothetical protein